MTGRPFWVIDRFLGTSDRAIRIGQISSKTKSRRRKHLREILDDLSCSLASEKRIVHGLAAEFCSSEYA